MGQRNRKEKYKRTQGKKTGKSFLIVTEGEKTEVQYFDELRQRLKLPATHIEVVHPPCTDPVTLVNSAIEYMEKRKKEVRKGISLIPYDEVWVVFDYEGGDSQRHASARQAIQRGKSYKIKFATSNPCFEYWLTLHIEYRAAPHDDCGSLRKTFNSDEGRHGMRLEKSMDMKPWLENVRQAITHAQRCRVHQQQANSSESMPIWNPYTTVHDLVQGLLDSSGPQYR